jgi:hypothetical protein
LESGLLQLALMSNPNSSCDVKTVPGSTCLDGFQQFINYMSGGGGQVELSGSLRKIK